MSAAHPTIAVFTKNHTNPAYDAARLGADRTGARLGARIVHYVPEKPDDVAEQTAQVEQAIAARPDAIVFVPVHATAMSASVRNINAAGIPLVSYLNPMSEGEWITFVGSDDYRIGAGIAEHLFRHLGGRGDVVIIEGMAAAVTNQLRLKAFHETARQWPRIRILASRPGDYSREVARRSMAALLEEFPRIDGVLTTNDSMSLGVIDALEAAGRAAHVIGINAIPEAITAVRTGRLLATADFDTLKLGSMATEAAIRHLRGQPVPKEIILPVQIVDRGNYHGWDKPLEQRVCPSWDELVR
jgi:ribose transport system substrate-binding protein